MSWGAVFGKPHFRSRMIPYKKKIPPFISVVVVRSSMHVCSSWQATVWVRLVCVTVLLQRSRVLLHLLSSSVAAVVHADHRCWSCFGQAPFPLRFLHRVVGLRLNVCEIDSIISQLMKPPKFSCSWSRKGVISAAHYQLERVQLISCSLNWMSFSFDKELRCL